MTIDKLACLNTSNYFTVHRPLAKAIGVTHAIFLSELISSRQYFTDKNQLATHPKHGPGWFYQTSDDIYERTGLTINCQETIRRDLVKAKIIEVRRFGLPAKNYFKINDDEVLLILSNNSRLAKNPTLGCHISPISTVYIQNNNTEQYAIHAPLCDALAHSDSCSSSLNSLSEQTPKEPARIKRRENIFTSEDEHVKLLVKYGSELTEQCYDDLSEWKKSARPSQVGKHTSDYRRITKWVAIQIQESNYRETKLRQPSSKKPVMAPSNNTTVEERLAKGGEKINSAMYKLLESKGRDMRGYIIDDSN